MRLAVATLLVIAAAAPASAVDQPKASADRRERINKVWDAQLDKIRTRQIAAGCKAEAKKRYSAIHFKKRRMFAEHCVE